MKQLLTLSLVVLFVACKKATERNDLAVKTVEQYTIEQFMNNEAISGGSFSPDNSKLLISSNRSDIYNVYTIPSTGGDMTPITQSDSTSIFAESYFPTDERMLLSADGNGDEIDHLFVRELDGTITDVTPEKGAKSSFYGWTAEKTGFYYGSNKRDARYFDVYEMDITDYKSKLIYQNNDGLDFR